MTSLSTLTVKHRLAIAAALAALMAATRFHHFGSAISLPDASLAVFFLAGFYLRSAWFLPLLLAAAALDYLAVNVGGVSDWCITPAYAFLLPAYASLWLGGRWYVRQYRPLWRTLVLLSGVLLVSVSLAFSISNVGFYLFSGHFEEMSWFEYATRVARYYPSYLIGAFIYVAFAAGLHALFVALGTSAADRPPISPSSPPG